MKLAAYHKDRGDDVGLRGSGIKHPDQVNDPDRVYVSCIYTINREKALATEWLYGDAEVIFGGSGISLDSKLSPDVMGSPPDHSIYDNRGVPGWPYGIGFSSRGCPRGCDFCIVWQKEGLRIIQAQPMDRIAADHDRILLLDNNLMMDPLVEEKLRWIKDWGGYVNYSQGIDTRVVAKRPDLASKLRETKYRDRTFVRPMITLSYDDPAEADLVEQAVKNMKDAGFDLRNDAQFFTLVNYNTTLEQDVARIRHLWQLGTMPFIMVYDKPSASVEIIRLQRCVNRRQIFWSMDWDRVDHDNLIRTLDHHNNSTQEPENVSASHWLDL